MTSTPAPPPVALTIAGSDSGGGAGLQADLKTWEGLGVYGASVVTCVTAQNTREVRSVHELPAERIRAQLDAVFDDIDVGAVKTGLLPSAAVVRTVAEALRAHGAPPLVVDPVLSSTSGQALASGDVVGELLRELFPRATLVTPNLDEASRLTGRRVSTLAEMRDAARALVDGGARAVLVKGGHLSGAAVDVLLDEEGFAEFAEERIEVGPVRGTGCTLSAAIASGLAHGEELRTSVAAAKKYLWGRLRSAVAVGRGARVLRPH